MYLCIYVLMFLYEHTCVFAYLPTSSLHRYSERERESVCVWGCVLPYLFAYLLFCPLVYRCPFLFSKASEQELFRLVLVLMAQKCKVEFQDQGLLLRHHDQNPSLQRPRNMYQQQQQWVTAMIFEDRSSYFEDLTAPTPVRYKARTTEDPPPNRKHPASIMGPEYLL